ncbi:MAG: C2 domain-containing protein [Nannocystales bacterium]
MPLLASDARGLSAGLLLTVGVLGPLPGCFTEPAESGGATDGPVESSDTSGGDTVDPDDTGDPSSASDGGCMGCLDAAGGCLAGDLDQACGVLAAACVACDAASFCDEGQCVALPACTPDNCDGCCDGDECRAGTELDGCGDDGFQCSVCSPGSTCNEGSCEPPCETTCDGCCDATGDCVPLESTGAAACGAQGATCENCGSGFSCSEGSCLSSACAESCDGCCDGDTCLDGASDASCGAAGSVCATCPFGTSCNGDCEANAEALWQVMVLSATTADANSLGDAWDSLGGLPDPFVTLTFGDTTDSTGFIANTVTPEWNEAILQDISTKELLMPGLYEVWDDDLNADDSMGACSFVLDVTSFGIPLQAQCTDDEANVLWTLLLIVEATG